MDHTTVMKELEAAGTEQYRKVYRRHGMPDPMFGVSYATLGKMTKQIGTDHDLALRLWKSGNSDARVLATMVADPAQMDQRALDAWAEDISWKGIATQVACLAARSPAVFEVRNAWIRSSREGIAAAGWAIGAWLDREGRPVPESDLEATLAVIEKGIHAAPNGVRLPMLMALISIGTRSDALEKKALAAANRIGKVEVDHGETGCKTPDPLTYIPKARAHRRAKEAKAAGKAAKKKHPGRAIHP